MSNQNNQNKKPEMTRGDLHQRLQRETFKLISNPDSAPVVLGMGAWQKFKDFSPNINIVKGDRFTFTNTENKDEYVTFQFDSQENLVLREENVKGHKQGITRY